MWKYDSNQAQYNAIIEVPRYNSQISARSGLLNVEKILCLVKDNNGLLVLFFLGQFLNPHRLASHFLLIYKKQKL